MSNDFYRRIQPQHAGKNLLRRALKNKKRTLLILLGCILILYVFFDNKGILARIRLESQRTELIEKVKSAEEETKKLQAQAKALESDKKTLEKTAREKYGMVRQGETVYRVKKD
ncbi:MAG: septum formation initiator family protein [Bacteroidota bacterium]